MGEGPEHVVLLHGLGGAKSSFYDTAAALSHRYRVHAIDLPGFGGSSKPPTARYDATFFARTVLAAMDSLGIARAHIVGNSMGGRVAIEIGLEHPERVGGLALLCPAVAFVRREWHPVVRVLRPEFGLLPHSLGRARIESQFWALFADRDLVDPMRGRHRGRRVRAHLPQRRRPPRLPHRGAQHLPREAVRPRRLLPAPGGARAAGHVRVVLPRQADPARLPAPRRALAALGGADPARRLRPRAPGGAPGAHQRPAGAVLRPRRRARAPAWSCAA